MIWHQGKFLQLHNFVGISPLTAPHQSSNTDFPLQNLTGQLINLVFNEAGPVRFEYTFGVFKLDMKYVSLFCCMNAKYPCLQQIGHKKVQRTNQLFENFPKIE